MLTGFRKSNKKGRTSFGFNRSNSEAVTALIELYMGDGYSAQEATIMATAELEGTGEEETVSGTQTCAAIDGEEAFSLKYGRDTAIPVDPSLTTKAVLKRMSNLEKEANRWLMKGSSKER